MVRKSSSERLIEEQDKLEKQKNKVALLEKQAKNDERIKRTKRLIVVGALTTKYFANDDILEPEKAKEILNKICNMASVKEILRSEFPTFIDTAEKVATSTGEQYNGL